MIQLLNNEKVKYEVNYRFGNNYMSKQFTSRDAALKFAQSDGVQFGALWVTLTTLEKIK